LRLDVPQVARYFGNGMASVSYDEVPNGVLSGIQPSNFADRPSEQAQTFGGRAQGQGAGEAHLLVEGHSRVASSAHPGDLDAPSVGGRSIAVSLDRVEIAAVVRRERPDLRPERLSVEIPDQVVSVRRREDPFATGCSSVARRAFLDRHLEEVGTL